MTSTPTTPDRIRSEEYVEAIRQQGGIFVDAVRVTRMPMIVTDATLPGNPITFANEAFVDLSGYAMDEVLGQSAHFMGGDSTDPQVVPAVDAALAGGRNANLELVQYRKDGSAFRAALFASPLADSQGRVINYFLSYLDVTRRYEAEENQRHLAAELEHLASELEQRVIVRTQELAGTNERLSRVVAEKEMLLAEVNHRAKNSLAIAAALLAVQRRRQEDPAVQELLRGAEDHMRAMAHAHDLLSKSEDLQQIHFSAYLQELCASLSSMPDGGSRITFAIEADDDILVDAKKAVPLGLVVTELITNAVKYAFPEPKSGTIQVRAQRADPTQVRLSIRDDGIGMSSGAREGSLGYGIVRQLVAQIDGEITVQGDAGVTVTVIFPV